MVKLMSFSDSLRDSAQFSKRHLLLGNGFSIACRADIFHYESLFSKADFSAIHEAKKVFDALGTQDFEEAIRALESGSKIAPIYAKEGAAAAKKMLQHAAALKELLVKTIAANHPPTPGSIDEEKFWACRAFLRHFIGAGSTASGHVFTLNYDLLLYWVVMHTDVPFGSTPVELNRNDSFGNDEDDPDADYVVWQGETAANTANIHYVHGALHLFDSGSELQKYTWVRSGTRLVEQARAAITANKFPLFVAEGESAKKKAKIRHNAYLYQSLKVLTANANTAAHCFFLFGHSLAANDDHILVRLGRGKFRKMYIGIYGDPTSAANQKIMQRAKEIASLRNLRNPLELAFFSSESANVWG